MESQTPPTENPKGKAVYLFLKFGKLEHLESLQKGNLFCNSYNTFANFDESKGIGDKYENVYKQTLNHQGVPINLREEFHNTKVDIERQSDGTYNSTFRNSDLHINLFCLYAIYDTLDFTERNYSLKEDMVGDYKHFLIIENPYEFCERVKKVLSEQNYNHHLNFVKYVDIKNLSGKKDYFEKPLHYRHQNEFRIGIQNIDDKVLMLDIGSIEDISQILSIEECKKIKVFRKNEDRLAYISGRYEELFQRIINKTNFYTTSQQNYLTSPTQKNLSILEKAKKEAEEARFHYMDFIKEFGLSTNI